jgi:hypothetical protein
MSTRSEADVAPRPRGQRGKLGWALLSIVFALALSALFVPAYLRLPLGADRADLSRFASGGEHAAQVLTVQALLLGAAKQPRCALAGEATCLHSIEQVYSAYVVRHPRGTFLIDAGVSSRVGEDLKRFSWATRLAFGFQQHGGLASALVLCEKTIEADRDVDAPYAVDRAMRAKRLRSTDRARITPSPRQSGDRAGADSMVRSAGRA